MRYILVILIFISSCAGIINDDDYTDYPKEIIPTIREFEADFKVKVTVPIKFADINPINAGQCNFYYSGRKEVLINKTPWGTLTKEQQDSLIYHELIHCELNIMHFGPEYFLNGCPLSLMTPEIFGALEAKKCFRKYKQYYVAEINMRRRN